MSTTRLDPTTIRTFHDTTTYGDVWNDNSDATYAPLVTTTGADAKGDLPAYPGGEITGMAFHVRASATGTTPIPIMVEVDKPGHPILLWVAGGSTAGDAAETYSQPLDWLIPNDGVIRDYVVSDATEIIRWAGWSTLDEMRSLWASGLSLYLWADPGTTTGTGTVLVYEAWVEIQSAGAPGLRIYPPVNNGKFGPPRHYPRAVNRRAGGTY